MMYRIHWKISRWSGHGPWMPKGNAISDMNFLNGVYGPDTHWIVKRRLYHWFV